MLSPFLRHSGLVVLAAFLLTLHTSFSSLVQAATTPAATPNAVKISGNTLTVDGSAFKIKGVAYSPVPLGENVNTAPYGDYFTPEYAYIWMRDLPRMKGMGFNTLRVYSWTMNVNHLPFLDTCNSLGLKVVVTHYMGSATATPVGSDSDRNAAISEFVNEVQLYGDHPAILMWSIGNEMNGDWNGFKDAISVAYNCGWDKTCDDDIDSSSACDAKNSCVFTNLWKFLDSMAAAAKKYTTRPITSAFADVNFLVGTNPSVDRLGRFDSLLPNFDLYMIQLYKGKSFGDYFTMYSKETSKPLLVGEYGVDSYNDPCGWPENANSRPCFNLPTTTGPGGVDQRSNFQGCADSSKDCSKPGAIAQSEYDAALALETLSSPVVLGGIVVGWHDEIWKDIGVQDFCQTPCKPTDIAVCADPSSSAHANYLVGGSAVCAANAHVTCSNYDMFFQDLCGYQLGSSPDGYVNEAWFGIHAVRDCGISAANGNRRLSVLQPRLATNTLFNSFQGTSLTAGIATDNCDVLRSCWECTTNLNTVDAIARGACDSVCQTSFTGASYAGTLSKYNSAMGAFQMSLQMTLASLLAFWAAVRMLQ